MLLALLACACAPSGEDFGIRVESLRAQGTADDVQVRAEQDIRLSREAREALHHGVPLRIRVDLAVRAPGGLGGSGGETFSYEIRYLPLSDHYQLSGPDIDGPTRTFPRLRHVLAELGELQLRLTDTGVTPGPYEVRMRSRLDRSGMPGPMQLPVFLSPQWTHDSGWVTSQFEIGG